MIQLPVAVVVVVLFAALIVGLRVIVSKLRRTSVDVGRAVLAAFAVAGFLMYMIANQNEAEKPGSYSPAAIDVQLLIGIAGLAAWIGSNVRRRRAAAKDLAPPAEVGRG